MPDTPLYSHLVAQVDIHSRYAFSMVTIMSEAPDYARHNRNIKLFRIRIKRLAMLNRHFGTPLICVKGISRERTPHEH